MTPLEVAIVGAGPAGLVSAKTILEECGGDEGALRGGGGIAAFEETSSAGGIWNLDADNVRQAPPCSCHDADSGRTVRVEASARPVYERLSSNLPKNLMSFGGYPYPSETEFFLPPDVVGSYFRGYARRHGLDRFIHYNTRVGKCWKEAGEDVWTIRTRRTSRGGAERVEDEFKSRRLLVCTGHFRRAFVPDVRGLGNFGGRLLHSSAFSSPKGFDGKTVLIVGGGFSGSDIAALLSRCGNCARVVVSVRQWKSIHGLLLGRAGERYGVVVRRAIDRVAEGGEVRFADPNAGEGGPGGAGYTETVPPTEKPDVIIFATGYRYDYPFLVPGGRYLSGPGGYKMERLYKRVLSIDDPTLAFIGVTNQNLSVTMVLEYQARWYANVVVKGDCGSLTIEAMETEVLSRANDKTQDALLFKFPAYCNSLARDAGARGFWAELLSRRLLLLLRSLLVRGHPSIYFLAALVVPTFGFLLRKSVQMLRG